MPELAITSPVSGSLADSRTVTVTGTTNAAKVTVASGDFIVTVTPSGGAFSVPVTLQRGRNQITVVAEGADGGTNMRQVTVVSFGTRVGGLSDPAGDDNGPGTYTYPTNSAFARGGFDLTGLSVFTDGDDALFVATIAGAVVNPWGGDEISHQRFNVYLGRGSGAPAHALPGTNLDTAGGWDVAVVGDGRFDSAGTYAPGATSPTVGGDMLAVPETRQIAVVVPRSALGGIDLATARYGIAMFGNGEAGEGIGYIRPVYDGAYWNDPPEGFGWIKEYRFGGGAGVWTSDAEPRLRHPRRERHRRDRRLRPDPGAGPRLAGVVTRAAADVAPRCAGRVHEHSGNRRRHRAPDPVALARRPGDVRRLQPRCRPELRRHDDGQRRLQRRRLRRWR